MTRFKQIFLGNPYEFVIKDFTTDRTYEDMGEVVELLNNLHQENQELKEENEQLKADNKRLKRQVKTFKEDRDANFESMKYWKNKALKE